MSDDQYYRKLEELHMTITHLKSEADTLRAENERLRTRPLEEHPAFAGHKALAERDIERLQAENERLRERAWTRDNDVQRLVEAAQIAVKRIRDSALDEYTELLNAIADDLDAAIKGEAD